MEKSVSILAVFHNEPEKVSRLWKELRKTDRFFGAMECIFLENASTDDGATYDALLGVEAEAPEAVLLIQLDEKLSYENAIEIGKEYSNTEYLIIPEAEEIPQAADIERIIREIQPPLISVIMPVRNNEKYLPAAVESVLDQKFENWELLILEGESTDRTAEIAAELQMKDCRIRVIPSLEWIYEAINIGIAEAKGRYFTVLNSDDKLVPDALAIAADYIERYDVDLCLQAVETVVCDEDQHILRDDSAEVLAKCSREILLTDQESVERNWVKLLQSGLLDNQLNIYKIECVKDFRFRNDVYGADYLYNLRILPKIQSVAYYPKCLYQFHIYAGVDGMNTSVGKYYGYAHDMFNDFYYWGLNLFAGSRCEHKEALDYLKQRRIKDFKNELGMLLLPSCELFIEQRIEKIFNDTFDVTQVFQEEKTRDDLDEIAISVLYQLMLGAMPGEAGQMEYVRQGILELFSIADKQPDRNSLKLIEEMVFHYKNPCHIGLVFLRKLQSLLLDNRQEQIDKANGSSEVMEHTYMPSKYVFKSCEYEDAPYEYEAGNGRIRIALGRMSSMGETILETGGNPAHMLIRIGNFTNISWGGVFELGLNLDHDYHRVMNYGMTHLFEDYRLEDNGCYEINIGSDVWVGRNVVLKTGIHIGNGAVIAANSVVVKDVPSYAIVGGNPARIIRYRFSKDDIEMLEKIRWWDWPIERIKNARAYYDDVPRFIAMANAGMI